MKKNILITGGLGLLGKPLVKFLSSKKFKVFVLDKSKNKKRNKLIKKKCGEFCLWKLSKQIFVKKNY